MSRPDPGLFAVAVLLATGTAFATAQDDPINGAEAPQLLHVGAVAPDVLALVVRTGHRTLGAQIPYDPKPGDAVEGEHHRTVTRDGALYGWLVGPARDVVYLPDRFTGRELPAEADAPATYRLLARGDPAYAEAAPPVAVHRKTRPVGLARTGGWTFKAVQEHVIYLRLPSPLREGKRYTLGVIEDWLPVTTFEFEPRRLRSPAVQVSHLGFRPDDPAKIAFLSCWMGSGGPLAYPAAPRFLLVNDRNGRTVFKGKASLSRRRGEPEDAYGNAFTGTDVYEMDFTGLNRPGTYRVVVRGIGCSYPFRIDPDAWEEAFRTSARGYFHQRSGIELGPPFTGYRRPRCFHPDDGMKVYHSTCGLIDSGNGLGREDSNFGNLVAGKTDALVPEAWGGYMDAGDWDRRIQHLDASRMMLELASIDYRYFGRLSLNLPESGNGLPDLVDEALFNLDHYRRMQAPSGGVRGGVESAEHPRQGEASWQESLDVMAYAPDPWSSYVYAGVAARASRLLRGRDAGLSRTYRDSAERAMAWAERALPEREGKGDPHAVGDARNLAAVELFALTGDSRWHDLFVETTVFRDPGADLAVWKSHDQRDAAWVYATAGLTGMDRSMKANCRAAIIREADARVEQGGKTAYHWTQNPWKPPGWGTFTSPDPFSLIRAHRLTEDRRYLRALVLAAQTGAGANPVNTCYTTGLGRVNPRNPLHVDSKVTNQDAPPGITIYGPLPTADREDSWDQKLVAPFVSPEVTTWPAMEAYWDVFLYPMMSEYTVMQTMLTTTFAWGYLAVRD